MQRHLADFVFHNFSPQVCFSSMVFFFYVFLPFLPCRAAGVSFIFSSSPKTLGLNVALPQGELLGGFSAHPSSLIASPSRLQPLAPSGLPVLPSTKKIGPVSGHETPEVVYAFSFGPSPGVSSYFLESMSPLFRAMASRHLSFARLYQLVSPLISSFLRLIPSPPLLSLGVLFFLLSLHILHFSSLDVPPT